MSDPSPASAADEVPPFDLDHFLDLPRLSGLRLSPDGRRLVVSSSTLAPDRKGRRSAVWQLDPAGEAAPRRLTRSAAGESSADFLPDGSLLFTSAAPIRTPRTRRTSRRPPCGSCWSMAVKPGSCSLRPPY